MKTNSNTEYKLKSTFAQEKKKLKHTYPYNIAPPIPAKLLKDVIRFRKIYQPLHGMEDSYTYYTINPFKSDGIVVGSYKNSIYGGTESCMLYPHQMVGKNKFTNEYWSGSSSLVTKQINELIKHKFLIKLDEFDKIQATFIK